MAGWSKVSAISLICHQFSQTLHWPLGSLLPAPSDNCSCTLPFRHNFSSWQVLPLPTAGAKHRKASQSIAKHRKALQSIAKHCKALHFHKTLNDLLPTDAISRGKLQICSWVVILLSRSNQTQLQKKLHFTHILLRVKVQVLNYTLPYLGSMHAMEDVDFLVW